MVYKAADDAVGKGNCQILDVMNQWEPRPGGISPNPSPQYEAGVPDDQGALVTAGMVAGARVCFPVVRGDSVIDGGVLGATVSGTLGKGVGEGASELPGLITAGQVCLR